MATRRGRCSGFGRTLSTYDRLIQQTRDSTEAVAEGGNLFTLLSAIREHEDQRTRLCAELAMPDALTMAPFDPVAVEQELTP